MRATAPAPAGHPDVDAGIRRLAPQPQPMLYVGAGTGLAASACLGVGLLSAVDPTAAYGLFGAGATVSAASLVAGARARQRSEITDHLTEQLCPVLGIARPSRAAVKLSRWQGGFVGLPGRVELTYHAAVVPDPDFIGKILTAVQISLGQRYTVDQHNERKHRITLTPAEAEAPREETEHTRTVDRTTDVVRELLGESAQVQVDLDDDGKPERIQVKHHQGTNMAMGNRRQRVERVLATRVPGEWVPRWDLQNDIVEFVARAPMPTLVLPPTSHSPVSTTHEAYSDFQIPLGIDEDNDQLCWTPRKQPHMVVVGTTGSGKTVVQHNVVERVTQAGWRVWILDGKRIEFIGFRDWPNVERIASRIEHQAKMIYDAHQLMEERYGLIEEGKATVADFEPLVLVIDEATTFLEGVDRWWKEVKYKGGPAKAPALGLIADIARLGRSAKIHMLIGLQRPDTAFISGEMRDNLSMRVAMSRLSPDGAKMMWESYAVGTAIPRHIKGRGMAFNADGIPVQIQTIYAPNPDPGSPDFDPAKTAAVRPRTVLHKKMLVEILDPTTEDLDGETPALTYWDYVQARVYEAPDQPIGGPPPAALPTGALAALQALNATQTQPELDATPESETPVVAERRHVPTPAAAGAAGDDFEGYNEPGACPAGDLEPGDLVQLGIDGDGWAVITDPPEPDGDDVYLEYTDRDTGEPGTCTIPAHEMLPTRRVDEDFHEA
ncbi:FtsK/SpoIIIE domain-containing protein [Kocuria palustris]|uniref:FtsK/SpoIIIE domain-containing protein n=1 Tax=Kocuria palustris TaxID=71999 RepID=UPI0033280937